MISLHFLNSFNFFSIFLNVNKSCLVHKLIKTLCDFKSKIKFYENFTNLQSSQNDFPNTLESCFHFCLFLVGLLQEALENLVEGEEWAQGGIMQKKTQNTLN